MKKAPRLQSLSTRARTLWGLGIGLGVGLLFGALRQTHAVEGLERRLVDTRTRRYLGDRPPDPEIVLAIVNSADVEELDRRWPWDLDVTKLAFDWLAECHVAAVAVDIYQFDAGSGPEEVDVKADDPGALNALTTYATFADDLAATYKRVGTVVLAYELVPTGAKVPPKKTAARTPDFLAQLARLPPIATRPAYARPMASLPVMRLLRGAAGVGFANADTDDDGTLRRASPVALLDGKPVVSLPLATLLQEHPAPLELGADRLVIGKAEQRIDSRGTFLVNFRGGKDLYEQVRPSDMVKAGNQLEDWRQGGKKGPVPSVGTARPEAVAGKLVIFGVNFGGEKDIVPTPISENFPGPEYQATVIDNLKHGDGRVEASGSANLAVLLGLTALLGFVGGATHRRGLFLATMLLLAGGTILVAFRLFAAGTSIDVFTPVFAIVVAYAGVTGFQLMTEGRRNKWLEGTFSQYLSPAVIEGLKSDPAMLELGGRKREITVIFSDVKGFTTISEKLESPQLTRLLNDYLTRQSEPVLAEDGLIDKFIGDALMAFFGDPVPVPDHALRACRAAVGCRAALPATDPIAHEYGLKSLENRIGIASGPAVVGNMGSNKRFSYTAMGDTVNFASRLEGANKAFASKILLGAGTYEQAKDGIVAKPIARLIVVGKNEPVAVYELLAMREGADPAIVRHAEAFTRAHAAVLSDDLPAARKALDEADAARPGDGPVVWLRGMIAELQEGRRPRPWNGVFVLDSK